MLFPVLRRTFSFSTARTRLSRIASGAKLSRPVQFRTFASAPVSTKPAELDGDEASTVASDPEPVENPVENRVYHHVFIQAFGPDKCVLQVEESLIEL